MKEAYYGLAGEGWVPLFVLAATAAWLFTGPAPAAALLPMLLVLLVLLKFRDPRREVPADPLGVLAPVDGVVADVDQGPDGIRVLIRIAAFSPYLLRAPTEGKILESGHGMRIQTDEGEEISLRLMGPRWLPPAAVAGYGERIGQGQRCGVLRAARAAEIWLPVDAVMRIGIGDRIRAGETVLGHFHSEHTGT